MESICYASSRSTGSRDVVLVKFQNTPLKDVVLIEPQVFGDDRGFFLETWQAEKFAAAGIDATFVQDNQSRSTQWTLRGLHFQVEHTQGKLVRVTAGSVFDVMVDLRRSSPSFGKWWGIELTAENHRMLWVPKGLAHGILVTSESADFLYKCTDLYSPAHERTLKWNDSALAINWPLPKGLSPKLSAKDASGMTFADTEKFA
jgi:dTDP-4-dehydrorhamnose 3,5-epimerase